MYRPLSLSLAAGAVGGLLFAGGMAQACGIDGTPSAYANGKLAIKTVLHSPLSTADYQTWWAQFTFPERYRTGQQVTFRENDALLHKVFVARPRVFEHPWRWRFGDSSQIIGDHATHIYRHPGHYRVAVDAYYPEFIDPATGQHWLTFDTITIVVGH